MPATEGHKSVLDVLNSITDSFNKTAADPDPSDSDEAGKDVEGKDTAHPSKGKDEGVQPATQGSRSAENEADIKASVPGQAVDEAEGTVEQDGKSESVNTTAKPTGEAPAAETASVSSTPGGGMGKDINNKDTEHPAKSDFGGKYASVIDLGNSILADIITSGGPQAKQASDTQRTAQQDKKAGDSTPATAKNEQEPKSEETRNSETEAQKEARAAGRHVAEKFAQAMGVEEQESREMMQVIKQAAAQDAELLCGYYLHLFKQAAGEDYTEENAGSGASESEPTPEEDGGKKEEQQTVSGGESDTPAPEAPAMDAGMGGGDVEELLAALAEMGITPEMLAQVDPEELAMALSQEAGGGMGMGGGAPAMPPAMPPATPPVPVA